MKIKGKIIKLDQKQRKNNTIQIKTNEKEGHSKDFVSFLAHLILDVFPVKSLGQSCQIVVKGKLISSINASFAHWGCYGSQKWGGYLRVIFLS